MTKKERRLIGKAALTAPSSVGGGFRAGKRRKGNSLLKRRPREAVTVLHMTVTDTESGRILAEDVTMITYRGEDTAAEAVAARIAARY